MVAKKKGVVVAVVLLACGFGLVSGASGPSGSAPLTTAAELDAVGGVMSRCAAALGAGAALVLAGMSPCSVVCLTAAWYDLLLIGAYCD